jgi:hypothetical protein
VVPPTQAPSALKAARNDKLPSSTVATCLQETGAPRAQPAQQVVGMTGPGAPLRVEVHGDNVTTTMFEYDMNVLKDLYCHQRNKMCLAMLLRRNAKDLDCPTPGALGLEPGGECQRIKGIDQSPIQCKWGPDGGSKSSSHWPGFGRQAGK